MNTIGEKEKKKTWRGATESASQAVWLAPAKHPPSLRRAIFTA